MSLFYDIFLLSAPVFLVYIFYLYHLLFVCILFFFLLLIVYLI